ncbi:MAG: citrate (Si)-synthase [Actinobacteria bacterium RBG_16_68_21]|nr:MAG: citrate (Si)-synthase [Actinobacteria bacterium RBG_16_68_21]
MGEAEATLIYDGGELALPMVDAVEGNRGIDMGNLRAETGLVSLDYGFANTAGTRSGVSFVNGEAGELRYRGYPIEQLAERSSFLEVAYLLFHGELPTAQQLESYRSEITRHTLLNEEMKRLFDAFPRSAHPMAILASATNAMAAFYSEYHNPIDPYAVEQSALRLVAKLPTVAAFAYKKSIGQPYAYPHNDLDYVSNFLHMMFALPVEDYVLDPTVARALDVLLILHADHSQNCSTSTVRLVGSSQANLFTSVASGMSALWGPLHGGANQQVVEMLQRINDEGGNAARYIAKAKDKDDPFRLWGFGHRVYKNYDPRARILKAHAYEVMARMAADDPLLDMAMKLEEAALADDYFIERKLYPNVDFYSGLMFRALGFPTGMFTVLFAIGRLPGWIAQWKEMTEDPDTKIGRPRQIYVGQPRRDMP